MPNVLDAYVFKGEKLIVYTTFLLTDVDLQCIFSVKRITAILRGTQNWEQQKISQRQISKIVIPPFAIFVLFQKGE